MAPPQQLRVLRCRAMVARVQALDGRQPLLVQQQQGISTQLQDPHPQPNLPASSLTKHEPAAAHHRPPPSTTATAAGDQARPSPFPAAPRTLKITPAMVVPVFVKPGCFIPFFSKNSFRLHRSKLKPPCCAILPAGHPRPAL